ncbi:hypothetical protein BpHYR1_045161 [Brachionus plicatilis]|uniref:Uncharacterized protein n=1 Tax=Brachionus plicatilis TaxID=10195 RepID=A0A3M7SJN7_BRAPC|nr:hypothetical protein BpHYR1_045161 [Brachionus plicatilis]
MVMHIGKIFYNSDFDNFLELILSYENYRKGDIYLFQLNQIRCLRDKTKNKCLNGSNPLIS